MVQLCAQREAGIRSMTLSQSLPQRQSRNTGLVLHSLRADHPVRKSDPTHRSNSAITPLRYKARMGLGYHLARYGSQDGLEMTESLPERVLMQSSMTSRS